MAFWKTKTDEPHTFADLIRGLQHSVNAAMEMLEARNIELLGRYFTEDGTARVRRLNIDSDTALEIPIISIVNPSALNIQEVEMDFSVQVDSASLRKKEPQKGFMVDEKAEDFNMGVERSSLQVSFSGKPDQSTMHVKIKFLAAPIPEGMSRVIEEYDKTIMTFSRSNNF